MEQRVDETLFNIYLPLYVSLRRKKKHLLALCCLEIYLTESTNSKSSLATGTWMTLKL